MMYVQNLEFRTLYRAERQRSGGAFFAIVRIAELAGDESHGSCEGDDPFARKLSTLI